MRPPRLLPCSPPPRPRRPPRTATAPRSAAPRAAAPRQGEQLRVARLRLRLRVRAGPAVRAGRHRRHRQRAALALLRARRTATSSRTSSTSGSTTRAPSSGSPAARRRTARRRSCATRSRASPPATTPTCARPAATSCPTRPAAARLGAPDHGARHVPALLPARPARQLGQLPATRSSPPRRRRHRGAAALRRPAGVRAAASAPDPLGSNAYGIGRDGARGGRSLLLGNPHFPWQGSERWYEMHLTIPGKLDAIGAALQGVPVVNIGFNRTSRGATPSRPRAASRRTSSSCAAGARPSYLVDGSAVKMRKRTVRVRVRGGGVRRHTFYETRWGPVFSFPLAGLTWAPSTPTRSPTSTRTTSGSSTSGRSTTARSRSRDLRARLREVQGNPWVNVIAADSAGRAYYADDSVVPNVDAALQSRCSRTSRRRRCCSAGRGPARRLAHRAAAGATTATRSPRASSARRRCRARRAATTWRTPTTPTGCRARASA